MNDEALSTAWNKLCQNKVTGLTKDEVDALCEACTTYAELN